MDTSFYVVQNIPLFFSKKENILRKLLVNTKDELDQLHALRQSTPKPS
jgi:hypothetical protein